MLLFLLLAIRFLLKYNLGNAFVAASEDSVTSVSDSSDISLFATDSMFELNDQEDPLLSFDSTTGANDQEDYFNGTSTPFASFFSTINRSHYPRYTHLTSPGLCRYSLHFSLQCPPTARGLQPLPKRVEIRLLLRGRLFLVVPSKLRMV